jgi:TolB-like protein
MLTRRPNCFRHWLLLGLCFQLLAGAAFAQNRIRVAVLPVHVNAAADAAYLQDGLADMLAARLGQHEGIAVIPVRDRASATPDTERARELARGLSADFVLFGSFTRFGSGASLDVKCLPVRSNDEIDPRSVFIQAGELGEIIPQLDGLVGRIARYVGSGPRATVEDDQDQAARARGLRDALTQIDQLTERVQRLEGADPKANAGVPFDSDPSDTLDSVFDEEEAGGDG